MIPPHTVHPRWPFRWKFATSKPISICARTRKYLNIYSSSLRDPQGRRWKTATLGVLRSHRQIKWSRRCLVRWRYPLRSTWQRKRWRKILREGESKCQREGQSSEHPSWHRLSCPGKHKLYLRREDETKERRDDTKSSDRRASSSWRREQSQLL